MASSAGNGRAMSARRAASKLLSQRSKRSLRRLAGSLSARRRPGVVLMLHIGRCGSTVLANMLHQHPRIYWDGKIYRAAQAMYGRELRGFDYRRWTPRQFAISGGRYYGFEFKFLPGQYCSDIHTDPAEFLASCVPMGVTHYILLQRENTLRQAVSYYSSKARGAWHLAPGGELGPGRFVLDVDHVSTGRDQGRPLAEYLRHADEAYRAVSAALADRASLTLSYEQDIERSGPSEAYRKVCGFLGLAVQPVAVRDKKINPPGLSELVENMDEVRAALAGTPYEWMLDEQPVRV
jgi:hypothetical protein